MPLTRLEEKIDALKEDMDSRFDKMAERMAHIEQEAELSKKERLTVLSLQSEVAEKQLQIAQDAAAVTADAKKYRIWVIGFIAVGGALVSGWVQAIYKVFEQYGQ